VLVDHRPKAGIRVSPHFYTLEDELSEFVELLVELRNKGKWKDHLNQKAAY
jgi:selenocysteine lyase/cysteine desulfurase